MCREAGPVFFFDDVATFQITLSGNTDSALAQESLF
jgi:hypothetical protein